MLKQINIEHAHLLPGLFKERSDINRAYLMELKTENLLQNFYLEACVRTDRDISEMHLGWESPTCQLRGHFLGHWLSAASMLIAQNDDRELKAKLDHIIDELEHCQKLNGGKWIGSIPEKYFERLENNEYIWSPQYTLHKTLLGLYHSALYAKNEKALDILDNAADWYLAWTADMQNKNPHAVYSGEEGGMLEVWAGLYQLTKNEKFFRPKDFLYCEEVTPSSRLKTFIKYFSSEHSRISIPRYPIIHMPSCKYLRYPRTPVAGIPEDFWFDSSYNSM